MRKANSSIRALVLTAAMFATACGGATADGAGDTTPPGDGDAADTKPSGPSPQDISFDVDPIAVQGTRFVPEALGMPQMIEVTQKRMPKMAQAKKLATKKKAKDKDVHIYVTLLATDANNGPVVLANKRLAQAAQAAQAGNAPAAQKAQVEADAAKQAYQNVYKEAASALRALVERKGDKAEERDVQRLAVAELWSGDTEAAITLYERLNKDFAAAESAAQNKAWLALLYLQVGRVADAAALVSDWNPRAKDTPHFASYVVSWVRFAERVYPEAIDAISAAAVKWPNEAKDEASRSRLLDEAMLMIAIGNGTLEQLQTAIANVKGNNPMEQLSALNKSALPDANPFNLNSHGRFERANEALAFLIENVKSPADQATFQFYRGLYATRLNDPRLVADSWVQAAASLNSCTPETCANQQNVQGTKVAIAGQAESIAPVYHSVFAATLDADYAASARALYNLAVQLGSGKADEFKQNLANLGETEKRAKPENGKHTKDFANAFLSQHKGSMKACYDGALLSEPAVSGSVKVTLEIADNGTVSGGSSEPAAGKEGLAAIAGCLLEDAKTYRFGGRSVPGTTRVSFSVSFAAAP